MPEGSDSHMMNVIPDRDTFNATQYMCPSSGHVAVGDDSRDNLQ